MRIIYLFVFLFLLFFNTKISAQSTLIDSLKNELKLHQSNDTTKVRLLNSLIYEIYVDDQKTTDSLIQESELLIEELNFLSGKAELLYYKGHIELLKSNFPMVIEYNNQAKEIYESLNLKKGISYSLHSIGLAHYYMGDYTKAIEYVKKSSKIDKERNDLSGVAGSFDMMGTIYADQGKYDKALDNYYKSKFLKESLKDTIGLSTLYNNIGSVFVEQSDYPKSLENFNKGLELLKKINNEAESINLLLNIATVYQRQKSYDKALKYYYKGLGICEEKHFKYETALFLNGIGFVYKEQNKNDKALSNFNKTLEVYKEINIPKGIAESLNNIANVQLTFKNKNKALEYYNQALEIYQEINSPTGKCWSFIGITRVHIANKNYEKALEFALKVIDITNEYEFIEHQRDANELLSIIYENMGNYNAALESHQQFKILNDSLFNKENIEKITQLEYEYKYKQELELASYKEQQLTNTVIKTTQDLEKTQRNLLLGVIAFLISVLILGFIIFFLRLRNAKSRAENILVEQRLLRSQMTPHFIFNSLSVLQGMILNKEDKKAVSYLSKFSKLLRITLENSRDKTVALTQELAAVENYLALQNIEDSNAINYEVVIDDNIQSDQFEIPPMLIQPFIENAIEHAFENQTINKKIDIHLSFYNKKLTCTISDNGKGIEATKEKVNQHKKSLATTITSERLKLLSKDFKMEASIKIENRAQQNEKGTKVTLIIPYKTAVI